MYAGPQMVNLTLAVDDADHMQAQEAIGVHGAT
jgi:hypothetical protein